MYIYWMVGGGGKYDNNRYLTNQKKLPESIAKNCNTTRSGFKTFESLRGQNF